MHKLKEHENLHKQVHETIISSWHYNFMDRMIENKSLKIYFDCSICYSTIGIEFDADVKKLQISNKSELDRDIDLVKIHGIENIFRVHPRGNIIKIEHKG